MTERIDGVDGRVQKLADAMATKGDIEHLRAQVIHEFKAAVENITDQLKGANQDEISSLQDSREGHEQRIVRLEERAGLR